MPSDARHAVPDAFHHRRLQGFPYPRSTEGSTGEGLMRVVAASPLSVLVDFWAGWCGPCRMAAPVLDDLARRNASKLLVLEVDVDQEQEIAGRMRRAA